jgi:cytosine/adenosine deaminase-related metal-dependent hydrolase
MPVVLHRAPVVLPVAGEPLRDGAVLVRDGRIVDVGRGDGWAGVPQRRWPGVLTPGLVNAHAHLQYGPSFADLATSGLPFTEWIQRLSARRADVDDAQWYADARASAAAMLASGTTAVADVVTNLPAVRGAADAGLIGTSYLEAVGADDATWPRQRARLLGGLDSDAGCRDLGVSPHTLYTLGTEVFRDCLAIARERDLRLHTHLAESTDESEFVLAGSGPIAAALRRLGIAHELLDRAAGVSPTQQLDAIGGLGADVHVAHGVHVDATDRALLRDRGTAVALCARSNRILHAGDAPVAAYLAERVPVAIGTDSLSSTPDLDLLAEAAALHHLAWAQGYAHADLSRRLIEAATSGGARALGRSDIGALVPGARADLAVFAVDTSGDPYVALLTTGAGRCVGTVLAGVVVHERLVE